MIKKINIRICLLTLLLLFSVQWSRSQELTVITTLPDQLKESSGLISIEDRLFTHNDSGDGAVFYEIDKNDGSILKTITIKGANNVDWEDVTFDDTHLYIADIGNNIGNRQDLKIYKVLKSEFLTAPANGVNAEQIKFRYKAQSDYSPSPYDTNFDAEAIVSFGDKLYLFSKNWINFETDIYSLPKDAGNYEIEKVGNINSQGLITAATYDESIRKIMLTGYGEDYAFVMLIGEFAEDNFDAVTLEKMNLSVPVGSSFQIEAADVKDNGEYYLTSETSYSGQATLFGFKSNATLSLQNFEKVSDSIFPNPASDFIKLKIDNFQSAEIFDLNGKLVLQSKKAKIRLDGLENGVYLIKAVSNDGAKISNFKLIKKN